MQPHDRITLSQLQAMIRGTLSERFADPLWVSAEIADIKVNGSGHCYMELVEKDDRSDGMARAQVRAVIWRSQYMRIAGIFEAESGQRLERGMAVLVRVSVSYHELYGLSLQITDIDASYTLGDMEMRKQQAIAQLKKEGVWDMNRECVMPVVVQRVAVVSSSTAAGFQDFRNELARSGYMFGVELFDSTMQGAAAEESIIAALERIAERQEEFDAAIIIRGGGAVTDLNCFNSYRLASHVAQFPLPVLTGIGHDKDVSVVDMVAHTPLKTPTAVAVWLNDRMAQTEGRLDYAAVQLHDLCMAVTRSHELRLERARNLLQGAAESIAAVQSQRLDHAAESLKRFAVEAVERQQAKLTTLGELVESRSPQRILRLGFAIARAGGRALTSAKGLQAGDTVSVQLADGTIETTVKN